MIADAIEKVGADGVLSIENGSGLDTVVEVEEGMEIDRGYISPQFVTNNEKLTVEFDNARILVTDEKIEQVKDLVPILEAVSQNGGDPLLIIAEDITGEALATLVVNKLAASSTLPQSAPGFGERRKASSGDIAIVTDSTFLAKDLGMSAGSATLDALGYARKVTVTNNTTTLVPDSASTWRIDVASRSSSMELANSDSIYDTQKLSSASPSKLSGGVAVIKVGAATEQARGPQASYRGCQERHLCGDRGGYACPSGGASFVHLSLMIDEFKETLTDPEEKLRRSSRKALLGPCASSPTTPASGDVVVEKVMKSDWEMGYNAMSGEFINMIEGGVIDPKKVTRSGLMNSCSIAGMVLTAGGHHRDPEAPRPGDGQDAGSQRPRCRHVLPLNPRFHLDRSGSKLKGAAIRGCFV